MCDTIVHEGRIRYEHISDVYLHPVVCVQLLIPVINCHVYFLVFAHTHFLSC